MKSKKIKEKDVIGETVSPEEEKLFVSLRASTWRDFAGQAPVKENLRIAITAAKKRKEPIEHILFYGPPGLGKTTLAHIIGKEMGANVRVTSGPAIERAGDLAAILTNLEQGDILFIDEIHRLNKVVEETLYPAMEEYALDIVIGKGPSARTLRLDLPRFTIIGATTRVGLLSSPMRDRFSLIHRLSFYSPKELESIITRAAEKLKIKIDPKAKTELAKRSRGTPRIALRLLKRVRDVAQVEGNGHITPEILARSLTMLEIDEAGLDSSDRRLLTTVIDAFGGGPVGIETIAAALSEDIGTVEEVLEPYLMQIGFMKRSPRGRVVTSHAFKHLGKPVPR
ncbi:MAG: Holliday junction DNA helicase RuvB, holliday junction DNA helicase RuvB [Microgenomates group bacterium GW2011_GWC1_49_7]|nr:MAG: Holliday junction DNA helicase RuvB, holliday junction DNA helicase RuvB [Microgenomates group bacterium GW2011_GWC1_49_7]